jgi:hypothetical protein
MKYSPFEITLIVGLIIFLTISVLCMQGCVQRICEYNPDTGVWRYQSNYLATDSQVDRIVVKKTLLGITVEIDKATQDNDSVEGIVPGVGIIRTDSN